jgi:hypothetical protein
MNFILDCRHTFIFARLREVRNLLVEVEVRAAVKDLGMDAEALPSSPSQIDRVTHLLAHANHLLDVCRNQEAGFDDEGGQFVTWERLVRCQELLTSIIDEQFPEPLTGPAIPLMLRDWREWDKARRKECGLWIMPDTATVREILDKVEGMVQGVRATLSQMRWEGWLKSKDRTCQAILRETWPILESAQGPLTRQQIAAEFTAEPDWTSLGKALSAAHNDGFLENRKKKPQGYFIPERFPDLIDPSK